jgi:PAS domain S-box-containing protein
VQAPGFIQDNGMPVPSELHPAVLALRTGQPQRHVPMGAHRPDGTLIWLSVSAQPLLADGESKPYAVINTFCEQAHHAHARSLECMDRVNKAIQGTTDLEQVMNDVLDVVLADFGCDRAFLLHPCDPTAAEWSVPIERTRPEYPGALQSGGKVPMDDDAAALLRLLLDTEGAVTFGQDAEHLIHPVVSERFGVKSQILMAIFPRVGPPWQFGIHQCSHARSWRADEKALFESIGGRLSDALTGLLMYRDLQSREQEFRTLAENIPDLLVRYDRQGRRTYVNPAVERLLGVSAEQLIGKTLPETGPAKLPMMETYQRALHHTLATGERSEFEMQVAGNIHTQLCFMAAERAADGSIAGAIAVSRDITELKRNEAELERHRHHLEKLVEDRTLALSIAKETAEAATRAKTRFLAAASHDLRQPLQAIRLFNDALAKTGLDEEQTKISRYLATSASSLGELLDKLLDISRLDAGSIEPKHVAIEAGDLLAKIGVEFDALVREKNLRLNLHWPQQGLALFTDDNLLHTLMRNLVGNAVKYTARGGVLVGIRRRGDHALIQVWDTGIGIPPEQTEAIFEEYFQVGNPERDRAKGVGLGLSIVRRLGKLLGIELNVRSREGKGSVFELRVPLAGETQTHSMPASALIPNEIVVPAHLAGRHIVVIEDDARLAEALEVSLEKVGLRVTVFGTAEDALAGAETRAADYFISDFRLPGMDGLQLLEAIQHAAARPIHAVLLTGETAPHKIEQARSSGWPVLIKPTDIATLLSALN